MKKFFQGIWGKLENIFNPEVLGARLAEFFTNIILALTILAVFFILWKLLRIVLHALLKKSRFDETAQAFIETIVKFGIIIIAAVNALNAAGFNTSAILASLGIVGLTLGFAAKDALSNLISGLLIFIDRPFVIRDLVEIDGHYGRVERITLRSTRVITPDGKMLAIPNTEVIGKTATSYTNFPHLRIDIPVNIGLEENIGRVRDILLHLVENDPSYLKEPEPEVAVTALNDDNLEIQLQVWIDDERDHTRQRHRLREKVFDTLSRENVQMPYKTFALTPVEVRMEKN